MTTTNEAYSRIEEKLTAMENCVSKGLFEDKPRKACMELRALLCATRRVLRNELLVGGNDLPPAA